MKQNSSQKRKTKGFTLVELIVVIAILAILSAVGAVAYTGYIEYTKKGLDKQTVGEIERALELADYADPTLFGDDGGAIVILSKDGIQAAGGYVDETNPNKLANALKDAFGDDLASTKMSFEGWEGTPDMSLFSSLGDRENIKGYLDAVGTSGITTYAGHVDEIWDIVTTMVNFLNGDDEASFGGVTFTRDGNRDYLDKIVTKTTTTDANAITTAWGNGNTFNISDTATKTGAMFARNYAFYLYAQTHPSYNAETMKEDLEKCKLQGANDYFTILSDSSWATIKTDYLSGPATQDANAYLGMMQAADAVRGENKGETHLDDSDYLSSMSRYTGMLDNVLTGTVELDKIAALAGEAESKNAIVINVIKENGTLNFTVLPPEASPRDGGNTNSGPCTEDNHTSSVTVTYANSASGFTAPNSVVICTRSDEANKTCTIRIIRMQGSMPYKDAKARITSGSDCVQIEDTITSNGQIKVTALKPGKAILEIKDSKGSNPYNVIITVH